MPAAGAYVVVGGQTYRVLDRMLDEVNDAVAQAMEKGTVLTLSVAAAHDRADGMGSGTLYLQGAQLAAVAVLSGPLPATGHPTGY